MAVFGLTRVAVQSREDIAFQICDMELSYESKGERLEAETGTKALGVVSLPCTVAPREDLD